MKALLLLALLFSTASAFCQSDYDCGVNQECFLNRCLLRGICMANADCPPEMNFCMGGVCMSLPPAPDLPPWEPVSRRVRERATCDSERKCPDYYDCWNNLRWAVDHGLCHPTHTNYKGHCYKHLGYCKTTPDCAKDQICIWGHCIRPHSGLCTVDDDCGDWECLNGKCVECITDAWCGDEETCREGSCQ